MKDKQEQAVWIKTHSPEMLTQLLQKIQFAIVGEVIQETVSEVGSKITEGAKDLRSNITEDAKVSVKLLTKVIRFSKVIIFYFYKVL
jgi:hypothetical protein